MEGLLPRPNICTEEELFGIQGSLEGSENRHDQTVERTPFSSSAKVWPSTRGKKKGRALVRRERMDECEKERRERAGENGTLGFQRTFLPLMFFIPQSLSLYTPKPARLPDKLRSRTVSFIQETSSLS